MDVEDADFIVNAQPSFADEEARLVSDKGRLNMHSSTSNEAVFERGESLQSALFLRMQPPCRSKVGS